MRYEYAVFIVVDYDTLTVMHDYAVDETGGYVLLYSNGHNNHNNKVSLQYEFSRGVSRARHS